MRGVGFRIGSFNGGYSGRLTSSRKPPYIAGDIHSAVYHSSDDLIVGDGMLGSIYRVSHDYDIIWEVSRVPGPEAVDYNPDRDTVLVYWEGGVLELSGENGKVLHRLSSTSLGTIPPPPPYAVISYDCLDPETFYLPVGSSVWKVDWNGNVLAAYGGMKKASSASFFAGSSYIWAGRPEREYGADTNLLLADLDGNEIKALDWASDGKVKFRFPFPAPWARWLNNRMFALGSGYAFGYALGSTYVFSFNYLKYYFPTQSNPVASSLNDPDMVFLSWDWGGYEVDLREWNNEVEPRTWGLWSGEELRGVMYSSPIPTMGFEQAEIAIRSSGNVDVSLEQASMSYNSPVLIGSYSWDGTWVELERQTVSGFKAISLPTLGMFYRVVVRSEDAIVSAWVDLR